MKRIRWGVMGTGVVARDFARGLLHVPDAELVAVGSRAAERAGAFSASLGLSVKALTYEDLLSTSDVDVVYIATPTGCHREHCLLALDAGKAVLCEKPLAMNAIEARQVAAAAGRAGLFCMEAMWMRFMPVMADLRVLLDRKAIGTPLVFRAALGHQLTGGGSTSRLDATLGGGATLDLGAYLVSLASMVFGPHPDVVVAKGALSPNGVDETMSAVLRYAAGGVASLTASLATTFTGDAEISGTNGTIRIHPQLYRPHRLTLTPSALPVIAADDGHVSFVSKMAGALRTNEFVRRVYWRLEGALPGLSGREGTAISRPIAGNGYNYEAAEVNRCLRAGLVESPLMPLHESVAAIEVLDRIRGSMPPAGQASGGLEVAER